MSWALVWQACKVAFSAIGFWWTALQGINITGLTVPSWLKDPLFGCICFGSILILTLVYRNFRLLWSNIHIRDSVCEIRVRAGNLLKVHGGSIAIGINNELSCDLRRIGQNSLHSQLLKQNVELQKFIEGIFKEQINPNKSTNGIFPNGHAFTTPKKVGKCHCTFLVMSSILHDQVIQTSPETLREAFLRFFDAVSALPVPDGKLAMPIIGSGPAGVNLSEEQILEMIACAFICKIPRDNIQIRQLTFVVRPRDLHRLNLPLLEQNLRQIADHCCYLNEGCVSGNNACSANTVKPSPIKSTVT